MPIDFTVFSLGFASGLVLYWLTNNVLSIAQQALYNSARERAEHAEEPPSAKGPGRRAKDKR
jgi:membrane protein insertase Oxa1/YidC/SpoIIIJ